MTTSSEKILASTAFDQDQKDQLLIFFNKHESGSISSTTCMTRAYKLLHPDQWHTFMMSIATPELRDAFRCTKIHKQIVANIEAPISINIDAVRALNLPPHHLAHLASTCRWMWRNITKGMIKEAVDRMKRLTDTPVKITRSEVQNPIFELTSNDGDEIKFQHVGNRMFFAKINSTVYVAKADIFMTARSVTFGGSRGSYKGFSAIDVDLYDMLKEAEEAEDGEALEICVKVKIMEREAKMVRMQFAVTNKNTKHWRASKTPDDLEFTTCVICHEFPKFY